MIQNNLNSQLLDIAMENTYLLLTDSKRFNEVFKNEEEFVVAFDLELSNVNFNTIVKNLIEYYVDKEEYEKCAQLVKLTGESRSNLLKFLKNIE
jgi:transposase